jgi:hypothetical protein
MDQFKKIFDDKTVKVLAGDITAGDWEFNTGTLWSAFDQVELAGHIKKIDLQTEESIKEISATLGWGLAGGLVFGPAGLLAGLMFGGNKKEVCILCELKDGRRFLAVMGNKTYQQMLALSIQ